MKALALASAIFLVAFAPDVAAQPVASVGASSVSRRDIDYRIAIERAYGGTLTRQAALASLVNDLFEREVARAVGRLPDVAELQRFSEHADQTSKAPEILAAVKRIFGRDSISYRGLYLAPRLINLKLHDYFNRDTLLHAAARQAIEQAYGLVVQGESFASAAGRTGLQYRIDSLSDSSMVLPSDLMRYVDGDNSIRDPYKELIDRMVPGKLVATIVETDADYQVLRLLRRDDSMRVVEAVVADKGEFDAWFRREADRVAVAVSDRVLQSSLISAYPRLWWIEKIRANNRAHGR